MPRVHTNLVKFRHHQSSGISPICSPKRVQRRVRPHHYIHDNPCCKASRETFNFWNSASHGSLTASSCSFYLSLFGQKTASHFDSSHTASADFKAKVIDQFAVSHRSTALLEGYWSHNYPTEEPKNLLHHHRWEYMKFIPAGIYADAETPCEP